MMADLTPGKDGYESSYPLRDELTMIENLLEAANTRQKFIVTQNFGKKYVVIASNPRTLAYLYRV
jgi:hypothetical protein